MDESYAIDLSKAIKFLGQGSFCDVHLVEIDGRQIAVKSLKYGRNTPEYDELLPAFKKECDVLVKLDHPNIIKTFGGQEVLKYQLLQFGILTEYCEMGTLRKLIFNSTILYSMKNVTIWSENLFDALDYMFKTKQIIHRDIKTENICVTKDFIVKLGDFGTTRKIDQTCTGTFDVGTLRYLSPPQLYSNMTEEELLDQGRTVHEIDWKVFECQDQTNKRIIFHSFRPHLEMMFMHLVWSYGNSLKGVFAEYETAGRFDYIRFTLAVVYRRLKRLDPPKYFREFGEIVESCCDFDRSKRPNIEEILERLREFKKINNLNDFNDGYPTIDKNKQELILPIGFKDLKNRELILVTSNDSEPCEKRADRLLEEFCSRRAIGLHGLEGRFIKRFNEASNHEKMDFIKEIEKIREDALNKNCKYFHEYSSYEDLTSYEEPEKKFDEMNLRQIFQEIVVGSQSFQVTYLGMSLANYGNSYLKMRESRTFSPWLLFWEGKYLDHLIEIAKTNLLFSNLKFKSFLSITTGEEWILVDDCLLGKEFLNKSFDRHLRSDPERSFENKCVLHSVGDELHSYPDFIIKGTEFVQLLERIKLNVRTRFSLIMEQSFCLSRSQTSKITQKVEKNLPIDGYLFQLTNPPRIQCNHHTKCDIKIQVSDDGYLEIPYYSCSSERQNNYLSNWMEVLGSLDRFNCKSKNITNYKSNFDPIILLQVIDSACDRSIEYITLLDFSDEYFNGPKVPCLNSLLGLCYRDGQELQQFFNETSEKKRRYLVFTPKMEENYWLWDYQGNLIDDFF